MTVAIGFVYDEGIVFCADTKVTTDIKTNESKLEYFASDDGRCAMVFTMASDDVVFPKAAVARCWEMVQKMDFGTASIDAVRNSAEFALGEFYRDHIYTHPDRTPKTDYFELLVGIWLRNQTRLYVLHETVLTPVDDYECIGAGAYLSKYLIRQYRQANLPGSSLADAAMMATFCVEAAIDYDERCGGEAEILIMRNDGDISNAYRTAVYPDFTLFGEVQAEIWRLLRGLALAQMAGLANAEAPKAVEKFCERIRAIEASHRKWGSGTLPESPSE